MLVSLLGAAILFATTSARADDVEDDDQDQVVAPTPPARAVEPPRPEPPPPAPKPRMFGGAAVGPMFGTFGGLPVQRLSIGAEGGLRWTSTLTVMGGLRFEPGRTENGLGAHRLEFSATFVGGKYVRLGAGAHLAYAMIVRTTIADAFGEALVGNIGGFGIGAHGLIGGELPLGKSFDLELHLRGAVEVYDGVHGACFGPVLAGRFGK